MVGVWTGERNQPDRDAIVPPVVRQIGELTESRQLNRRSFPKFIRAETGCADAFSLKFPRVFTRPERAEKFHRPVGGPIEVLIDKIQVRRPPVARDVGNGELLDAPAAVRRPVGLGKIKRDAGFARCRLFIAATAVARHSSATLEFAERDREISIAFCGRPRLGSPLRVIRASGIADNELGRIRPAAVGGGGKKSEADRFTASRKSADLPPLRNFAWESKRVGPPTRIVEIALLVENAKSGQ